MKAPLIRRVIRRLRSEIERRTARWNPFRLRREVDDLYAFLHRLTHDLERPVGFTAAQTRDAFGEQWRDHPTGQYLLSDPWFRDQVDRILWQEELQLAPSWFAGRRVLDAGCGNGRWSYGFARLGADLTAVDANPSAVEATRAALEPFATPKRFVVSPLERLDAALGGESFDLVFCWGVLHHCGDFLAALDQVSARVASPGVLYLYLYGRESLPLPADIELFKKRVHYNMLADPEAKRRFLLDEAFGDPSRVHYVHDVLAPLVNRRFTFEEVRDLLRGRGFADVRRTIESTELFVRAIKGDPGAFRGVILPPRKPPYWFRHHEGDR